MDNLIVAYLTPVSLVTVVVAFIGILLSLVIRGNSVDLAHLLTQAISAGGLPVGLALLYCVYDPPLLQKIEGSQLYITIAALSILVLSGAGVGLIKLRSRQESKPDGQQSATH